MSATTRAIGSPSHRRMPQRAVGILLILLMALGMPVLLIGVPVGSMWLASTVTESIWEHSTLALLMTLVGMLLFALLLIRLNRLYLRVTGVISSRPGDPPWRVRGPLEPIVAWSVMIALVALFVWFFFFAENFSPRPVTPIGELLTLIGRHGG